MNAHVIANNTCPILQNYSKHLKSEAKKAGVSDDIIKRDYTIMKFRFRMENLPNVGVGAYVEVTGKRRKCGKGTGPDPSSAGCIKHWRPM